MKSNGKTGWAAGKSSMLLWCIWLENSTLVRKCEEDSSHGALKSSGTANPALLPGESLKEKYQQERELSWKPEKLFLCSLGKAASVRPRGPKESHRSSEYLGLSEPSLHSPTLTGGRFTETGAKWPNPAHSCLSKPTLTALSEAFFEV